jgi:hypothetical protein
MKRTDPDWTRGREIAHYIAEREAAFSINRKRVKLLTKNPA